jgi:hypothetical protein
MWLDCILSDNSLDTLRYSGLYLGQFLVVEPSRSSRVRARCVTPVTQKHSALLMLSSHILGHCTHMSRLISEFVFQSFCVPFHLFIVFTTVSCLLVCVTWNHVSARFLPCRLQGTYGVEEHTQGTGPGKWYARSQSHDSALISTINTLMPRGNYSRQTMRWSVRGVNILSAVRGSITHAGGQKTSYWSAQSWRSDS